MRRVLVLAAIVALVGLGAAAQVLPPSLTGPIFSNPASMDRLRGLPYLPDFLFASDETYQTAGGAQVDAGTGLPVAVELADAFNTYGTKSGAWGYVRADGGSVAWDGGVWVAATGTSPPAQESPTVCPNGPSCGPVAAARTQYVTGATTGQFGWEGTTHVPPAGAYTICVHAALVAKDFQTLFAFSESGTGSILWQTQNNTTTVDIYTDGVNRRTVALTPGAPHVLCVTCSADQLTGQAYLDGVASGATFTCTTAAPAQSPRVSGVGNGSFPLNGSLFFGAFHTEAQLSAGDVSSISRATLASQPYGLLGDGGTLNAAFTRTSATFCDSVHAGTSGAGGSKLPAGRYCAGHGHARAENIYTNKLLRSQELENAFWTLNADLGKSITRAASPAVAPDGTLTATRFAISECSGTCVGANFYNAGVAVDATSHASIYARSVDAGTQTFSICVNRDGTCAVGTPCPCQQFSVSGTGWKRLVMGSVPWTASGANDQLFIGCNNYSTCGWTDAGVDTGAADIDFWGAQIHEASAGFDKPLCTTTSAAMTCDPEAYTFTLPNAIGPDVGVAVTTEAGGGNNEYALVFGTAGSGNNMTLGFSNATTTFFRIGVATTAPAVASSLAEHRLALQSVGTTETAYVDGVSSTGPNENLVAGQTSVTLSNGFGGTYLGGWLGNVCILAGGLDAGCAP